MAIDAQTIKNLPPQHKLLIGVLILGLIAGGFYYLVIRSIDESIMKQRGVHAQAKKTLKEVKDFQGEEQKAQLMGAQARLQRKIARNKELIPTEDDLHGLMATLLADAEAAGVKVIEKEQLDKEYFDKYYALPVSFKVQGSYLDLVKFLKLVSGVQMSPVSGEGLPERIAFEAQTAGAVKRLINIEDLKIEIDKKSRKERRRAGNEPFSSSKVASARSYLVASFVAKGFVYPQEDEVAASTDQKGKKGKKGKK